MCSRTLNPQFQVCEAVQLSPAVELRTEELVPSPAIGIFAIGSLLLLVALGRRRGVGDGDY